MKKMHIHILWLVLFALLLSACKSKTVEKRQTVLDKDSTFTPPVSSKVPSEKEVLVLPEVPREFRAAWIATVANINWPSRNSLSVAEQKKEAIYILDRLSEANFNAVIFQARPSGDAFYESAMEPWSYFLTGTVGKAPEPYYDPLQFWIQESHKRGMQLHVWINPYRAHHTTGGPITSASLVKKMPEQIKKLRNGMYWMDPSDPQVQDHVSRVIADIVQRYEIDAIHIDDYFYPYKEYNGGRDFPDENSWMAYLNSGGTLTRADWRRANVNKFIKRIHTEIKDIKPTVKFGISPFGIWKSGYPQDVKGTSQFDELYADAKLWLNEGWLDYFSPQLYWKEEGPQRFSSLLRWWQQENSKGRHLWPGLNTVGVKNVESRASEIQGQMSTIRRELLKSKGEIHYSIAGVLKDPLMYQTIKKTYEQKALVPKSPWINAPVVPAPRLFASGQQSSLRVEWRTAQPDKVFGWILYAKYDQQWQSHILGKEQLVQTLPRTKDGKTLKAVALRAVDRLGNESDYEHLAVD